MKHIGYCSLFLILFLFSSTSLTAQQRDVVLLDGDWSLCMDPDIKGLNLNWGEKGVPARGKRPVVVPHTFNTMEGYYLKWCPGWYEKKIYISKNQIKKSIRLQFDAVNHDAIIYVNGKKAGEHMGSGYTKFFIDITPFVHEGENLLVVYASNEASATSIPYKKSFDWSHDGGIIRSVHMLITEPQAMRTVMVTATPVGTKGNVQVRIPFFDASKVNSSKTTFRAVIREENQKTANVVYNGKIKGSIVNGIFTGQLNMKGIKLWHFDQPNMYRMEVTMYEGKKQVDEYAATFGFRTIKIENNRYVLNGEPMRLMGMEWTAGENMEHGLAQTKENIEKGVRLMKEANCVFARCHWQQSDYFLDLCDRYGILVMEEVPLWGWEPKLNDTLLGVAKMHLDEMIESHYNHPGIILWGLGNELSSHEEINIKGFDSMEKHAKALDPTRLVAYISNAVHWEVPGPHNILPDASSRYDMIMYNEYNTTWYGYNLDSIPVALDRIHKMYPDKPVTISEWGICEPKFKGGDERRAAEMVEQLKIYGSKDYVAGAIYFCLNDYRTHFGEDSTYRYPQRIHGVVDVNLNKKPSYDTLAAISAPFVVREARRDGQFIVLALEGKVGIPQYTIRDYYLVAGESRFDITELKPGDVARFRIESPAGEVTVYRGTGFPVMNIIW